jgi:hypothetical protein
MAFLRGLAEIPMRLHSVSSNVTLETLLGFTLCFLRRYSSRVVDLINPHTVPILHTRRLHDLAPDLPKA